MMVAVCVSVIVIGIAILVYMVVCGDVTRSRLIKSDKDFYSVQGKLAHLKASYLNAQQDLAKVVKERDKALADVAEFRKSHERIVAQWDERGRVIKSIQDVINGGACRAEIAGSQVSEATK